MGDFQKQTIFRKDFFMTRLHSPIKAALTVSLALAFCCICCLSATAGQDNPPAQKYEWATPIKATGLPNFNKVSDELYRGEQPFPEGFKELKNRGIKTVISLRAFHSDEGNIAGTGLAYESISFKTWHPEEDDMVKFLKIVTDTSKQPVFVHCQHGSDRTGTMCALSRMAVQGWPADEAIREMKQGGFGFHTVWQNLEPFLRSLNIEELKAKAGIVKSK
jgi:protein tyrosine phosphatase (PTP) superfamily phosphohydrolase (DUF442 family)